MNIPASQFYTDGKLNEVEGEENTYYVTFTWGNNTDSQNFSIAGKVVAYDDAEYELSAGAAPVRYYVATAGESAVEGETIADYQKINFEGLQIEVTYNDGADTREIVVDADFAKKLSGKFGTIVDGAFKASGTDGEYPTTAGDYVIQVSLGSDKVGTYAVSMEKNRVESTSLYVADGYEFYTDGSSLYYDAKSVSGNKLDSSKIYVVQTMTNKQQIKATDVVWEVSADEINKTTADGKFDAVTIVATKDTKTTVYAKYAGSDVATTYTRNIMSHEFAPVSEEIASVELVAGDVKLVAPTADAPYNTTTKPINNLAINGFKFTQKYNSGRSADLTVVYAAEPNSTNYTWRVNTIPSFGTKTVGDTIAVTVSAYDKQGALATEETVIATLVASLT